MWNWRLQYKADNLWYSGNYIKHNSVIKAHRCVPFACYVIPVATTIHSHSWLIYIHSQLFIVCPVTVSRDKSFLYTLIFQEYVQLVAFEIGRNSTIFSNLSLWPSTFTLHTRLFPAFIHETMLIHKTRRLFPTTFSTVILIYYVRLFLITFLT